MSEPMGGMTGEQWLAWLEVWGVAPALEGDVLMLRPGSRVPPQYAPLIREAKPRITAQLVGEREQCVAELEHLSALLLTFETRGALDEPGYLALLSRFGAALSSYEAACMRAPEWQAAS